MKYYWWNLFKEIAIGFNHDFQMISESLANFSDILFSKLVNAAIILVFSSTLEFCWSFA